jgi:NAD(P)-dependent dehydrogenase (short-subunit alcohol dehydrogenase family)
MKLDLAEKVALVTGSSRGIGWAIAQTLHAEGCRVTLNGRNEVDLTAATTEVQQVGFFSKEILLLSSATKPKAS